MFAGGGLPLIIVRTVYDACCALLFLWTKFNPRQAAVAATLLRYCVLPRSSV